MTDGDGLHFRGIQPHYWWNRTEKAARILWTGTLPLFRPRTAASKKAGRAGTTGTPAQPAKTKSHRKQEKR
ncbi:hypothetical protein O3W52_29215 [Ensifer psoraleae]|uniref:Uncharacterized protein n=1 Tax=Sinorhizobium psoraleae TaxID=520838 RepID=A0ABT4KRA7_9HYPH|nr:hypothetical protein [Sinorhizobium psoraleae]